MTLISLLASLPPLKFGKAAPMSMESFFESCAISLGEKQGQMLQDWLSTQQTPLGKMSQKWRDYRISLNHELALARTKRLRRGDEGISSDSIPLAPVMDLEEILQATNPLQSQSNYFKLLWKEAEHLEFLADGDLEKLALYAIRLDISDQMSQYRPEEGEGKLNQWLEGTLEPAFLEQAWRNQT